MYNKRGVIKNGVGDLSKIIIRGGVNRGGDGYRVEHKISTTLMI